jgi:DNA-binding NarL/FixJ family response regulator
LLPREVFSTPELDGEESDLLQLIGAGLMNREIAAKYDMPMWVVAARVSALYGAMDVLNRPNCAHVAWCTGLLGADS